MISYFARGQLLYSLVSVWLIHNITINTEAAGIQRCITIGLLFCRLTYLFRQIDLSQLFGQKASSLFKIFFISKLKILVLSMSSPKLETLCSNRYEGLELNKKWCLIKNIKPDFVYAFVRAESYLIHNLYSAG